MHFPMCSPVIEQVQKPKSYLHGGRVPQAAWPFRQIRERTDSSDFLEIHCKRGPGHRSGFGKILQMPWVAWNTMHQAKSGSNPLIPYSSKQTPGRGTGYFQIHLQDLNEHELCERLSAF